MSEDPRMQDYLHAAQTILETILRLLEFDDARVESTVDDDQIFFQIVTSDAGRIIGRTSQTLDAIQFLVNRLLSRQYEDSPYCVVDAEHYRERRREKLLADTNEALDRVRQTGQPWRMPLLNAMERRIIHQALKDCPDVLTQSEDEDSDGRKRVVIYLRPMEPAPAADPV
ncbi:MAG: KH domain-containing protein [Lentisphaerae bacterium]|nr:KH domain-containing protein [Lentisphaerota bacterium]